MTKAETVIQGGLIKEAIEMVGKATTTSIAEMESEKKQKLGLAIDRAIHGSVREKAEGTIEGIRQGFGLSIVNGVQRANQALETVRDDARESKGYAIAKGVVNVPAQIMRGIVVDTAIEVAQVVSRKREIDLPDLPMDSKVIRSKDRKERSLSHEG